MDWKVVCGLEGSPGSERTIEEALLFADKGEISLVRVLPKEVVAGYQDKRRPINAVESYLTRVARTIPPHVKVKKICKVGAPAEELVKAVDQLQAQLLVICSHHSGARPDLGEVSGKLPRLINSPLLINRGDSRKSSGPYKRILVALDSSIQSERGARLGLEIAKHFSSRLLFFRSRNESSSLIGAARKLLDRNYAEQALPDEEAVNDYLSGWAKQAKQEGIDAEVASPQGNPASCIVDEATQRRQDLIIIGRRGSGGLGRWLIGSTADRVARHAPCSVLMIPLSREEIEKQNSNSVPVQDS